MHLHRLSSVRLVWLLVGGLSGLHAGAQDRLEAPAANTARLILDSNSPADIHLLPQTDCSAAAPRLVKLHPTDGERLRGAAKDIQPGASRWLHVRTRRPDAPADCDLAGSFRPEAGRNYIAMFRADGERQECMLDLMQQLPDGSIEQVPGFQAYLACEASGGRPDIKSKPLRR